MVAGIAAICSGTVPLLVTVTVFAGLVVPRVTVPNDVTFETVSLGVAPVPDNASVAAVPLGIATCKLVAFFSPVDVGAKSTLMVQVALVAKVALLQVLLTTAN
jgi:hypothetical protein